MADFSMSLTAAGADVLAKTIAGKTLKFTGIALGDGTFDGNPVDATSLNHEVKRLPIQRITRRKNTVSLRATLEIGAVRDGFIWSELGVFAVDPDTQSDILYMYGYAGAKTDTVTNARAPTQIEKIINVDAIVAGTENVTAEISTSLVYLTQADLDAHNADPAANPAAIGRHNTDPTAHAQLFAKKADLDTGGKVPVGQLPKLNYVTRTGDTMTGNLTMTNNAIVTGLPDPKLDADAVSFGYLKRRLIFIQSSFQKLIQGGAF